MEPLKLAVIGLGSMGTGHMRIIDEMDGIELYAVCDTDEAKAKEAASIYKAKMFTNHKDLLEDSSIDAITIATPHYDHTPIAIDAFAKGIHVLVEKPVGVDISRVQKMIEAYEAAKKKTPGLRFGAMFQQRTQGGWKKMKEMVDSGELGTIIRATWIITNWYRTQAYYDSGGWRATWEGEGGGVLMNQCPHNLDLFQWMIGPPDEVTGFIELGKYHTIEVEDEVTAIFHYKNGAVGHFITTTGESPGTNRFEIIGDKGKLVAEGNNLTFYRNRKSMFANSKESKLGFSSLENWKIDIPVGASPKDTHGEVVKVFCDGIRNGTPLVAEAAEGIHSVGLINGIILSGLEGNRKVDMASIGDSYDKKLQELIASSKSKKDPNATTKSSKNMSDSYGK